MSITVVSAMLPKASWVKKNLDGRVTFKEGDLKIKIFFDQTSLGFHN